MNSCTSNEKSDEVELIIAIQDMTHPEDRWALSELDLGIRNGLPGESEFHVIGRDGRVGWLWSRREILMGTDSHPRGAVEVASTLRSWEQLDVLGMNGQRWRALMHVAGPMIWTRPLMASSSLPTGERFGSSRNAGCSDPIAGCLPLDAREQTIADVRPVTRPRERGA